MYVKSGFLLIEALVALLFFSLSLFFLACTYANLENMNRKSVDIIELIEGITRFYEKNGQKGLETQLLIEQEKSHTLAPIVNSENKGLIFDNCTLLEMKVLHPKALIHSVTLVRYMGH